MLVSSLIASDFVYGRLSDVWVPFEWAQGQTQMSLESSYVHWKTYLENLNIPSSSSITLHISPFSFYLIIYQPYTQYSFLPIQFVFLANILLCFRSSPCELLDYSRWLINTTLGNYGVTWNLYTGRQGLTNPTRGKTGRRVNWRKYLKCRRITTAIAEIFINKEVSSRILHESWRV